MVLTFFNHQTLLLAYVLTKDNQRQSIIPDFFFFYLCIFSCVLALSFLFPRTYWQPSWFTIDVPELLLHFVSDCYPDHIKALGLITIVVFAVLTPPFLGFYMFLCYALQCQVFPLRSLFALLCDWLSSLYFTYQTSVMFKACAPLQNLSIVESWNH